MSKMIQAQGDLLVAQIENISFDKLNAIQPKDGRITILEGEAHHHAHTLKDPTAVLAYEDPDFKEVGCKRFVLNVMKPTQLEQINFKTGMGYVSTEEYQKMKEMNDKRLALVEDLHAPIDLAPGQYEIITQRTFVNTNRVPGTREDLEKLIRPVAD